MYHAGMLIPILKKSWISKSESTKFEINYTNPALGVILESLVRSKTF